jgi:hypothetical protein
MKALPCAALVLLLVASLHRSNAFLGGSMVESLHKQVRLGPAIGRPSAALEPMRFRIVPLQVKKTDTDDDNDLSPKLVMTDGPEKDLFVFDNVIIWEKISGAVAATAWGFLAVGFLLNIIGFDFVMKDGKLTVDTLEKAQFESEINRVVKRGARQESSRDHIAPLWNDDAKMP